MHSPRAHTHKTSMYSHVAIYELLESKLATKSQKRNETHKKYNYTQVKSTSISVIQHEQASVHRCICSVCVYLSVSLYRTLYVCICICIYAYVEHERYLNTEFWFYGIVSNAPSTSNSSYWEMKVEHWNKIGNLVTVGILSFTNLYIYIYLYVQHCNLLSYRISFKCVSMLCCRFFRLYNVGTQISIWWTFTSWKFENHATSESR